MKYDPGGERLSATAKAKVRKGTLLSAGTFRRLLECSHVSDVAHMLRSTYYADYLPADAETLHRNEIEFHLLNTMKNEVQSFFSSADLKRRAFLKLWLERWDIQLIKSIVWKTYVGRIDSNVEVKDEIESPSPDSSLIDRQKLLSSNNIEEVIASIKNEKLVMYMEESMKRPVGKRSPALAIGLALDMFQNNRTFDAANCFSGKEKEGLLSLVGTYMDSMNIISMYRGKKYFNTSDEITLSLAFCTRYRVNFEMLKTIASLPSERMWELLVNTKYASLLPTEGGSESDEISSVAGITRRMRFIQRTNALKVFRGGGAGVHFVLAYLILREFEILSLNAVIEIVRYNYDRDKVEKLLALSSSF